jgi:hypothetical protein
MWLKSGFLNCKLWFFLVFVSSWKFLYLFLNSYCAVSFSWHQNASYQKDICQTSIIAFCRRIMQHDAQIIVGGLTGLLHCTQHTMQKNDDCLLRTYSSAFGSQKGKRLGVSYNSIHTMVCCPCAPYEWCRIMPTAYVVHKLDFYVMRGLFCGWDWWVNMRNTLKLLKQSMCFAVSPTCCLTAVYNAHSDWSLVLSCVQSLTVNNIQHTPTLTTQR